jgi:ABC-type Fe3+/spermidine/putrescine transport system ATPase subunit
MREEIRRIHDQTRITTIYVTHDQKESLSMADRMAVLREGVVEQIGEPRDVYRSPANRFVADFIGESNWLPAVVLTAGQGGCRLESGYGVFEASGTVPVLPVGAQAWVGFRPESVQMGAATMNALEACVASVTYLGEIEQYQLELPGGVRLKAFEQNPATIRRVGEPLTVHVRPGDVMVLPAALDSDRGDASPSPPAIAS